jgi:hypothetical protein
VIGLIVFAHWYVDKEDSKEVPKQTQEKIVYEPQR